MTSRRRHSANPTGDEILCLTGARAGSRYDYSQCHVCWKQLKDPDWGSKEIVPLRKLTPEEIAALPKRTRPCC